MSVPLISTRWEKPKFVRARFSSPLSGFITDLPGFFWADQNSQMSYILQSYIYVLKTT